MNRGDGVAAGDPGPGGIGRLPAGLPPLRAAGGTRQGWCHVRRRVKDDGVPVHLAEFVERDRPGPSVEDRIALWQEAREAWADENHWPGGHLARLRDESDLRRRMDGLPLWSWGRTAAELSELDGQSRADLVRDRRV